MVKPLTGHSGEKVIRCTGHDEISRAIAKSSDVDDVRIVQPFVPDTGGRDIRVIVIDGHIAAAFMRIAAPGEFRSNTALGGSLEAFQPDDDVRALAVSAASACGLEIAGVDILESPMLGGRIVCEVNTNCGVSARMKEISGVDVAAAMADYVGKQAAL